MSISYDSIGQVCVTFQNSGAHINQPCRISASNTVSACLDTNNIDGVVVAARSNLVTVVIKGFVTLPYTGSAPQVGYCPIAATGTGKVKMLEGAREYLVVQVDSNKKYVTFCL